MTSEFTNKFNAALQRMGTNAIPPLISKLGTRPLLGTEFSYKLLGRNSFQRFGLDHSSVQRFRAMHGLKALGSVVTNAIPEILNLPSDFFNRQVLSHLGSAALPQLAQHIRSGPLEIKSRAMSALEMPGFDSVREETVAIWTECLTDDNASIRLHAARLIGNSNPIRSQAAIPALQLAATDPRQEVAAAAKLALKKLQPQPP